jgi:hypothetical protein
VTQPQELRLPCSDLHTGPSVPFTEASFSCAPRICRLDPRSGGRSRPLGKEEPDWSSHLSQGSGWDPIWTGDDVSCSTFQCVKKCEDKELQSGDWGQVPEQRGSQDPLAWAQPRSLVLGEEGAGS